MERQKDRMRERQRKKERKNNRFSPSFDQKNHAFKKFIKNSIFLYQVSLEEFLRNFLRKTHIFFY